MPTYARRRTARTAATAAATAALLLTGLTGCTHGSSPSPAGAAAPAGSDAPSASASASGTGSAPASAPASASTSPSAPASPSAPPAVAASASVAPSPAGATTAPPPAPTLLTAAAGTPGGRLSLVRGGAAQEFTVTLRNGNSAAYGHLLVVFQMEALPGAPGDLPGLGPGFRLERFDRASGTWHPATLRIAGDEKPASLYTGGAPLARDAVRVERYRLRATVGGPTGSSPLMVSFIDTDADRQVATRIVLPHNTR
ncbi:hypothetical protein KPP03845_106891 [Streptomyces xanthophaeus]|uniref:hypothetical protein n=1 Tax=Streptomyces xanthophaeus TaxID=67385 RepID=UPI00233F543A|nr:hypothetical protein [Streptomyces xanthophaeus]WCD90463.1 hypothetical protein KPP03845_106891 [Streptomyces xanthophaeus]